MLHGDKPQRAEPGSCSCSHHRWSVTPPAGQFLTPPHTFFGLGVGDLQVTAGHLQLLMAHDLLFQVAQGNVDAMESHCITAEFGGELVVDTGHGWGPALHWCQCGRWWCGFCAQTGPTVVWGRVTQGLGQQHRLTCCHCTPHTTVPGAL